MEGSMTISRTIRGAVSLLGWITLCGSASAGTLYYTNFNTRQIYSLDTVSRATTLIDSVPGTNGNPDSLIFDSTGRIIYTIYNGAPGQLRVYDPVAHTDTLLTATAFGSQLVDVTLEPGSNTILVADRLVGTIDRVNIGTGVTTTLGAVGAFLGVNGITYDNSGNLFAAVGPSVEKINSTTGAVIATGGLLVDGLTFDSVSGKLWGAAQGGCLYNFDTTTLAASACINTSSIGSGNDGIVSDGAGHIFFAATGSAIVGQYTISGGGLVAVSNNLGSLDDIAPASGLGAPQAGTPEPGTFVLGGIGVAVTAFLRRKKA
jgi:streptogramin lyase